ncbi:MAG: hypothetical protein HND53_05935 [Proteobacteria bacterium]|nr:hypothetical protein [Pseudomonadota bacterium]NOG60022.1 hypothetical protein [Pseudomonadota bacterium]
MRLISILDVETHDLDEYTCRTSGTGSFIVFIIFLAIIIGVSAAYAWSYFKGEASAWLSIGVIWVVFWCWVIAWLAWSRFKSTLLPSNWLLRINPTRVLVKFRSFQNYNYPETDNVVLDLSWHDIEWVRKTKETSHKDKGDGTVTEFITHLDIKMKMSDQELDIIKNALKEESNRKPLRSSLDELRHELFQARKRKASKYEIDDIKERLRREKEIKSLKKSKSSAKYHDYPVRIVHDNILRVRWNEIKPNIKKTLALLSKRTNIDDEIKIVTDSSKDGLSGKELEDMILDRITRGDHFDATHLIKRHYGYSTTDAVKFIKEISNKT